MTTWVLLRGLMRESRHWGEFPHYLVKAVGNEAIVCLDFPGNGTLHTQSSLLSIPEMANDCRQQLLDKGYPPPYHVLAISLGAMVAVAWADRHPEEINSTILINTSLAPYNPLYQRLRPQNYLQLLGTLLFGNTKDRESLILKLTSKMTPPLSANLLIEQWIHYSREYPTKRRNILRQLVAASQFKAPQRAPKTAILLLTGQQDQLVDTRCSSTLAKQWDVNLHVHNQAGHDLPLDDQQWVIQTIQDWHRGVF